MKIISDKLNVTNLLFLTVLSSFQLIFVGCNSRSTPTSFPSANVTITPTATVDLQVSPPPTLPSIQIRPTATDQPLTNFTTEIYNHPNDLFSLLIPDAWTSTQNQMSASFTDPQQKMIIDVQVVNTGYALDSESFLRFINAREVNQFSEFNDYIDLHREYGSDKRIYLTKKQLSTDDVLKTVVTYYRQLDQAIFILDYWAEKEESSTFQKTFEAILESVKINVTAIADLDIYSSGLENVYQNDYFVIELPPYWQVRHSSGTYTNVDTFISPDEHAIIQTIIYDDGSYLSGQVAGKIVLSILRDQYAKDISVFSDTYFPSGREQLMWKSENAGYQGVTIFDTHETALIVITVMWDTEFQKYYQGTLDHIINTYQVLPAEGE